MSVNVANESVILRLAEGEVRVMARKNLKENMTALLSEGVTEAEKQLLSDMGFNVKKPNKYTVIAAALYKKAASGDMTAIKELRALVSEAATELGSLGVVRIIDDIGY